MDAIYTGEPMQAAFNPQYLLDGLAAIGHPMVVLSFTDPKKPALMMPATADGEIVPGYRYLMMPIRIGT